MTKRNRQSGATLVEASLSVGIMVFLLLGTIDLINMFRYASVAYSVAITTARYGAVPAPNITEPDEEKLFLPQDSGDPPYLVAWRDHEWKSHGYSGTGPPMAPQVLRALNLGLGLASDIFGSKARTVSNWKDADQVFAAPALPGEFYLIPQHYLSANKASIDLTVPASYRFCFNFSGIVLPDTTVCRDASAIQYDQV